MNILYWISYKNQKCLVSFSTDSFGRRTGSGAEGRLKGGMVVKLSGCFVLHLKHQNFNVSACQSRQVPHQAESPLSPQLGLTQLIQLL